MTVHVTLGGVLGDAIAASRRGRLAHFVVDEHSEAIALFDPQRADRNEAGDWYGEHAGKWLSAAARAAVNAGDDVLAGRVRRVASYLASVQRPDGYLGTYAPGWRFTDPQPPVTPSWDGAPGRRTWDVWVHAYMALGLLDAWRATGETAHLEAARRVGMLCWHTVVERGVDLTTLGNHHGMSATVFLDAAVELFFATHDPRFVALAETIVAQADARPALQLQTRALAGVDAAEIATGKAYQLAWNVVGLAKLYRATGDARHLDAARNVQASIARHHLTLGGGPWGGVAHRSREVFNAPTVFSPDGYVETCSTLAWIQLDRALWTVTGEAMYADEIERSAYNDLLGAMAPDGENWLYYSFPNGRRVFTTPWRCCKSSGAMALEELPAIAYVVRDETVFVNLYGPGHAVCDLAAAGTVTLTQTTDYPFDGTVRVRVTSARTAPFAIALRIPGWARDARLECDGVTQAVAPGTYATLRRTWSPGDEVTLVLPMPPVVHRRTHRNVQESVAPDGSHVAQEVLRRDYAAITRGPLVYATGPIDGYKTEETLRWKPDARLTVLPPCETHAHPAVRLDLDDHAPLVFHPYFEAGGRRDGTWRLTWMRLADEETDARA